MRYEVIDIMILQYCIKNIWKSPPPFFSLVSVTCLPRNARRLQHEAPIVPCPDAKFRMRMENLRRYDSVAFRSIPNSSFVV